MVDIITERTVASNYLPTVKQLPEINESNENLISDVDNNVFTMGEAQSEIIMECNHCSYSTRGTRRGRLKKRLETHMVTFKASILQAGDTTATESEQLESNFWNDGSEKITGGDAPPTVSHHGVGVEHLDTAAGGVVTHLPLLDLIPAHIVQASRGRKVR